ncbi:putative cyclase-domain-containing protein [Pestalotiopsis sp. NC0098]|nr:putative cyclase-domain-containing protein [Pestalotiopsis sp. NC0098]
MSLYDVPDFDDLPPVEGMPQGCAWGIFDKDGQKDLLGTLNLLTPDVVAEACKEARDGVSVSLNWPLNSSKIPTPGRLPLTHKITTLREAGTADSCGWDDELHFNTQTSSQWDSLVHWQHQDSELAYNGIKVTHEGLSASTTSANAMPTLDHWHKRGGLVARGVLIDVKAWHEAKAKAEGKTGAEAVFHPLDGHRITAAEMEAVARDQGVEFRRGDVLIVRTGQTEVFEDPQPDDLAKLTNFQMAGVHGNLETVKWLWNKHFSAVASDNSAFEALMPVNEDGSPAAMNELVLHPWLLSMFGMSIGELWDLKALSDHCKKVKRYSFLLTSVPMHVPGLVGSPPNALAIF